MNNCICPGNTVDDGNSMNNCICPGNTVDDGSGGNVCACPGDTIDDGNNMNNCICPGNTVDDGSGGNVCACPGTSVDDGNNMNNCICPGQDSLGSCLVPEYETIFMFGRYGLDDPRPAIYLDFESNVNCTKPNDLTGIFQYLINL